MLCVEDWIDTLKWAEGVGGLTGLIGRANANLAAVERFVRESKTYGFLASDEKVRSNTSVCLSFVDPWFSQQAAEKQAEVAKKVADLLEKEGVALDIGGYRDAPPGLRVWCGATVERADVEALLPWLEFAYQQVKAS
jgi:phosphoserine aminotransferase